MGLIEDAIRVARKYYDENTYQHAMRVAAYITQDNLIPDDKMETCVVLAIMHDLLEDTDFNFANDFGLHGFRFYILNCLKILTWDKKNDTYCDYLINIKEEYDRYPEAYWVKLSDMKDHLTQTETLTDKLKEKYLKALPSLL